MTTKHTVVADHTIENFRDDLVRLMFHSRITELMALNVHKSPLRGDTMVDKVIKTGAQSVYNKLGHFMLTVSTMAPANAVEGAILEDISEDMDPFGHKMNNIANVTTIIARSKRDYTDRIDFVFSKARQKDILKRCWKAAKGNLDGFEEYYTDELEYAQLVK